MHASLLPVESAQQCMQCLHWHSPAYRHSPISRRSFLPPLLLRIVQTDSSDMIVSQAARAGDVRTFQQEMDSNMHTFCGQVHSLHMALLQLSSCSLSAVTQCIAVPTWLLLTLQTHRDPFLTLPHILIVLSFNVSTTLVTIIIVMGFVISSPVIIVSLGKFTYLCCVVLCCRAHSFCWRS